MRGVRWARTIREHQGDSGNDPQKSHDKDVLIKAATVQCCFIYFHVLLR